MLTLTGNQDLLTLAELEAAARSALPVLLPFLDPGVPREEARLLQLAAQLGVELAERPRDAVAKRPGLRGDAAAVEQRHHVELLGGLGHREGLLHQHLQRLV